MTSLGRLRYTCSHASLESEHPKDEGRAEISTVILNRIKGSVEGVQCILGRISVYDLLDPVDVGFVPHCLYHWLTGPVSFRDTLYSQAEPDDVFDDYQGKITTQSL